MPRKTYITNMPDKAGAFLLSSKIIAEHNGNIVRASYNKAVDLHTLFIDVEAAAQDLIEIEKELDGVGYINNKIAETRVIVVGIKIPDVPHSVLPVLEILNEYDINISYINSSTNDTPYQNFKMGLLIEDTRMIKKLLDDISRLYQIDIIDYDDQEEKLDNTIFYIRMANEMQTLLDLTTQKTMEFVSESNRILQMLQEKGENPDKVFNYIRKLAHFISLHRGGNFKADIEKVQINETVILYSIQPPCGSNTYVLDTTDELVLIDTGYAVYAEEMRTIFNGLFPDWHSRPKRIYITHADVDHCGLLLQLQGTPIYLNQKSADSLRKQWNGDLDYRENNYFCLGYSRLNRIISGYTPPWEDDFCILDQNTPEQHSDLLPIGSFIVSDLVFEVLEGSGGHLHGEMIFVCRKYGVVFTGDILVNISGFSAERAEFNALAPYLMTSVNVDSAKASAMRRQVINLIEALEMENQKSCIVCGGHGPVSVMKDGMLVEYSFVY